MRTGLPAVMPGLMTGADCTTPSSTIATCLPTFGFATLSTKSWPPRLVNFTLTPHDPLSYEASAVETASPVRSVGPNW